MIVPHDKTYVKLIIYSINYLIKKRISKDLNSLNILLNKSYASLTNDKKIIPAKIININTY